MATILFADELYFVILISYLQKNGRAIDNAFGHKATILCLLGAFLFVDGTSNKGHVALLSVVEEMHCDWTPMSLIIAKTIVYLDRLHHHPDRFFLGSPLLL